MGVTVDHLRECGPTPVSELPTGGDFSPEARAMGATTFKLTASNGSPLGTGPGGVEPVAYLFERHDKQAVLRAFFNANPGLVENGTHRGLMHRVGGHGQEWKEAMRELLVEEYDVDDQRAENGGS